MSGNMSGLNYSNPPSATTSSSHEYSHGRSRGRTSSSLQNRGSLSFSEGNSMSSFYEDKASELEGYRDKDVWSTRFILSALEDIVFEETPFPKLSPTYISALQKFLLGVNAAALKRNPYVELSGRSFSVSSLRRSISASASKTSDNDLIRNGIPKEIIDCSGNLPLDNKIVIKSFVSTYLRNIPSKILELWTPILEMEGVSLPTSEKKKGRDGLSDGDVKGALQAIEAQVKMYQKEATEIETKLKELSKKRDEEMAKFERDTHYYKKLVEEFLKEESAQNDPEVCKAYRDYIDLEKSCIKEEIRLEELKQDEEENPEEEQEETRKLYEGVKALYDKMLHETVSMEEKLEQYKSLGSEYLSIRDKYKDLEEQIKTKEWVREQLQSGPKDDSLLNDTL